MDLFGVAFASYLYGGRFGDDRLKGGQPVDLRIAADADSALRWLNGWRCRLPKDGFTAFSAGLSAWHSSHLIALLAALPQPRVGLGVGGLTTTVENLITPAFDALRGLRTMPSEGRTLSQVAAAKLLWGLVPEVCAPWDDAIRRKYVGDGVTGADYVTYLRKLDSELATLLIEAASYGLTAASLPTALGRPNATLAKLADEYNWMTITTGLTAPPKATLQQWLGWA